MTPAEAYEVFLKGRDADNDANFTPNQHLKHEYDFADLKSTSREQRK